MENRTRIQKALLVSKHGPFIGIGAMKRAQTIALDFRINDMLSMKLNKKVETQTLTYRETSQENFDVKLRSMFYAIRLKTENIVSKLCALANEYITHKSHKHGRHIMCTQLEHRYTIKLPNEKKITINAIRRVKRRKYTTSEMLD